MAKMKDYMMDQYLASLTKPGDPRKSKAKKRIKAEKKSLKKKLKNPSLSQARANIKMSDLLGVKPHKPSVRTIKQAERAEKRAKKVINKKPLPARSRSGAASGRGGRIVGGLGSGPFGPRIR